MFRNMYMAATLKDIVNFVAPELIVSTRLNNRYPNPRVLAHHESTLPEGVSSDDWFYRYVLFGMRFGLMEGVDEDNFRFEPGRTVTHAEFITMLGRLYEYATNTVIGIPGEGMLYERYLNWAVELDIIHGSESSDLMPDAPVNYEQSVVFVYRYVIEALGLSWTDLIPPQPDRDVIGIFNPALCCHPELSHGALRAARVIENAIHLPFDEDGRVGFISHPQDSASRMEALVLLLRIQRIIDAKMD